MLGNNKSMEDFKNCLCREIRYNLEQVMNEVFIAVKKEIAKDIAKRKMDHIAATTSTTTADHAKRK
jgi:hypothetical protein